MKCEATKHGDVVIIKIVGAVKTKEEYNLFKEKIEDLIEGGWKHLVLDMEHLEYINSSGLGRLILAEIKIRQLNGSIKAVAVSPEMKHIFEITRLNESIKIYQTVQEALS